MNSRRVFIRISSFFIAKQQLVVWGLRLFTLRLGKPHVECLGTTTERPSNLKLNFLPFSEGIIIHSLKLAAMEEKVFTLRRLDEAKSLVCD